MTATDQTQPDRPNRGRAPTWLVLAARGAAVIGSGGGSRAVTSVNAGPAFLRLLQELSPALVVLASPPAGSTEIVAALIQRRRRPATRLIFLNDPADVSGRLSALADGFDDALPASIDPEELSGRALVLLEGDRRRRPSPHRLAVAPGVELDPLTRRVRRAGSDVHLRPREYALLAVLAANPGRVFSRQELVEQVWGGSYTGGPRTVDVHVRWLRSKLEMEPGRPVNLVTVRSIGYRLNPSAG